MLCKGVGLTDTWMPLATNGKLTVILFINVREVQIRQFTYVTAALGLYIDPIIKIIRSIQTEEPIADTYHSVYLSRLYSVYIGNGESFEWVLLVLVLVFQCDLAVTDR